MMPAELPRDIESERAVLGSVLLNRDAIIPIAPLLTPDCFYLDKHGDIWQAMLQCYSRQVPPDTRTVLAELRTMGKLERIGGMVYLSELVQSVPTSYHVEFYAQPVINAARLRQLASVGSKIAAMGYDSSLDADTAEADAQTLLTTGLPAHKQAGFIRVGEALTTYLDKPARVPGLLTGLGDLDRLIGGIGPGNLALVCGIPGSGKTSFALQVAWQYAKLHGPAGVFSFEMTRDELIQRLISFETGISSAEQRADTTDDDDLAMIRAQATIHESPLYIEDERGLTVSDIRLRSLRLAHEVGRLGVIVVDYLSLISMEMGRNITSAQAMNATAQALKNLAGDLKCPILLCAQLNRDVFKRPNKTPQYSDIREAGEAPADQIIVPMRWDQFDPADRPGEASMFLLKSRHGPPGVAQAYYDGKRFRFRPLVNYRDVSGYSN